MVEITEKDRLLSWASWHKDESVNARQAKALALDALATREKLTREALVFHLGRVPAEAECVELLHESQKPGTRPIWICWGNTAIAVRTDPVTQIEGGRINLIWYWKTLPR